MRMTHNYLKQQFGGGKYTAPEIEMYESVVERGFLGLSDDGLEEINGDGVIDENDKWVL